MCNVSARACAGSAPPRGAYTPDGPSVYCSAATAAALPSTVHGTFAHGAACGADQYTALHACLAFAARSHTCRQALQLEAVVPL